MLLKMILLSEANQINKFFKVLSFSAKKIVKA